MFLMLRHQSKIPCTLLFGIRTVVCAGSTGPLWMAGPDINIDTDLRFFSDKRCTFIDNIIKYIYWQSCTYLIILGKTHCIDWVNAIGFFLMEESDCGTALVVLIVAPTVPGCSGGCALLFLWWKFTGVWQNVHTMNKYRRKEVIDGVGYPGI